MSLIRVVTVCMLLLPLAACVQGAESDDTEGVLDFRMPNVSPKQKDIYLCHAIALNPNNPIYITEVVPHANSHSVHHMSIIGCSKPGSNKDVWYCNDFDKEASLYCSGQSSFIYAWGKNASELRLPKGVGIKVGGDTSMHYLVMQVHYNHVESFLNGGVDHSGVQVKYTFNKLPRAAAYLHLYTADGVLQPGQQEHFDITCPIDEDIVLHPLAFRTHTHQLGLVSSGYRVRNREWTELGRRAAQLPQNFVPAKPVPLTKGDVLAARCTMFNFNDHPVRVGSTHDDEMCQFYILYYTDGEKTLSKEECTSKGPPLYYWKDDKNLDVTNIPADVNVIPPPPNGPTPPA